MENVIVETARVLPKGQITLPKDFGEILGVTPETEWCWSASTASRADEPAIYAL